MAELRAPDAKEGDCVRAIPDERDCEPIEGPLEFHVNWLSVVPLVKGWIVDPSTIEVLEKGSGRDHGGHLGTLGDAAAEARLYKPRGAAGRSWSELWDPMEECVRSLLNAGWDEVERFSDSSEGIDAVTALLRRGDHELELQVDDLLVLWCWLQDVAEADAENDDLEDGPTEPELAMRVADGTWAHEFTRLGWI